MKLKSKLLHLTKFNGIFSIFSARIPGNFYAVYVFDFIVQMIGSAAYFFTVFNTCIYFIGMCFYINTMGADLKARVTDLDRMYLQIRSDNRYIPMENKAAWAVEIQFHNEIMEYALLL